MYNTYAVLCRVLLGCACCSNLQLTLTLLGGSLMAHLGLLFGYQGADTVVGDVVCCR